MLSRELENDIIRHIHRAEVLSDSAIGIVNPLVREQHHHIQRGFPNEFKQMPCVNAFEVALERRRRHSKLAKHESGKSAMPPAQPKPGTGSGNPVAHHVNMHIDPHPELIAFARPKVHFLSLRWISIMMS